MTNESAIMKMMNSILSHGVDGIGPLQSSKELAKSYQPRKNSSVDVRDAIACKCFGFVVCKLGCTNTIGGCDCTYAWI